jgi:iron(III) transport system substrate-binding protein
MVTSSSNSKSWILGLMAAAVAAHALAQQKGAPDASLLQYQGADREQKLLASARKEGAITFYTTIAEKDLATIVRPFERKHGIKVDIWRAGTDKVLQRTLSEAAARRFEVDVIHFGSPEMEALHREKILQPVASPHFKELIPGAVPAHREWVATILSVWVQAYNTKLIKKQELPRSYRDLLDPKWKGKLGIEAKNQEWFWTVSEELGGDAGIKFFRELVARNGISVRQGHSLLTNMVASGEVPLALTVYNYLAEGAKQKGAPVDWFAIEPAVARSNAIGIARRAPHPGAALLFYDYMITEAQKYFVSLDYVPTNAAVASPLKNLRFKLVDPVQVLDEMDRWTQLYQEVVIRRAGS